MSGNDTINDVAEYEESDNLQNPGSRSESISFFDGLSKRLLLFGGYSWNETLSTCIIFQY